MAAEDDLVSELLEPLGGVTMRRMFGGLGVFKDGLMFALRTSQGVFYFRANEVTAPAFEAEGFAQWTPEMKGRVMPMPYWQVPERLFDEPDEFAAWAQRAFDIAVASRQAKTKPAGKSRKPAVKQIKSGGKAAEPKATGKKKASGTKAAAKRR